VKLLDTVLERLEAVEPRSRGSYQARCPTHQDRRPSLSISESSDGRIVLFCHASCPTKGILDAIGLSWRDLYPSSAHGNQRTTLQRRRAWQIRNESGELIAVHHRRDG
jgi:hypothetical protein